MSTRILAIDTATEACSVALWNNGESLALFEICPREHTQRILPMVQQILAEAGVTLAELDALAFGRGPGSFTGVRIGVGIAQGLALGAGLPMIGVSTLATMAQGAWRCTAASRVLSAIDARMGEVYWGEYCRDSDGVWHGSATEAVFNPQQVGVRLAALQGNGRRSVPAGRPILTWRRAPLTLRDGQMLLPHAEDMLPLALHAWQSGRRWRWSRRSRSICAMK
ncbi:tRNA (adenosine(37)-N6)-threonylcarbamoyltransferase complex dimerization subunit type 1 TsaB [Edwardsiella piscicida]|nr:tRNA (adenosine(37)-N6)-threonylcarbamoyltransferase complex dimerization subunit type 1 TsaB [Edwardsiella piscicida]